MPVYKNKHAKKRRYYFITSIYGEAYTRRGFKTIAEATAHEIKFRRELIGTEAFINCKLLKTYHELLNEYASFINQNYKKTYAIDTKRKIKNFYYNLFPNLKVYKLTIVHAQRARDKINNLDVSVKTKNDRLNFLKRFFMWVNNNYSFNYTAIFNLNNFRDYEIKRQKIKQPIIEFNDFIKIYKSCDSDYYKLALLTLFIYGFRLGELLALKVEAFDFKNMYFETYQSVSFKSGSKRGYILVSPKTRKSDRLNKMSKNYAALIKKHIDYYSLKPSNFVFFRSLRKKSTPEHENTMRRHLETYCKAFNEDFHPHMLRTSIVTHLKEKGVSIDDIANYIGHETSKVTEDYYLKTSLEKESKINQVINEFINKIL